MSVYRKEWPCCGDVSETNSYEPETCPFCTPLTPVQIAAPDLLEALKKIADADPSEDGCYYTNKANISIARAAIKKAVQP